MIRTPLVVVGDTLLDVDVEGEVTRLCPEAPVPVLDEESVRTRPGGAGLAAVLAALDGREVTLVTALARDEGGRTLAGLLARAGVELVDLGCDGETPTKERLRCDGRVLLRVDRRGSSAAVGHMTEAARRALAAPPAILVSDYGRGVAADPEIRAALAHAAAGRPLVWDPHPRGGDPVSRARLVTPNRREAELLVPGLDGDIPRARELARRWKADAVCVTLGSEGAVVANGGVGPLVVPAPEIPARDACGAGDRFASSVAGLLADGALLAEAVAQAVRTASAFVAGGGAGSVQLGGRPPPHARLEVDPEEMVARVRAAGGTVVMTGGCFDLLHAGHVRTLEAARGLGDCLVVCLNSDDSVRRLKGRDRPLVPEEDRAAVLRALGCVDAVVVFDDDTPEAVLERFQPDVFAKGGDYALDELPERSLLATWGGEVVILPYVEGRSTTKLLEEAQLRVGS